MLQVTLASWLILVAAFDLGQLRVPNWLAGGGALVAIAAMLSGQALPSQPSGWMVAAGVAGSVAVLLPAYVLRVMGAGDVKLGMVLALWFSLPALGWIWVAGSLLCGLHALALIALPFIRLQLLAAPAGEAATTPRRRRQIPYGAYLAIGALATMAVQP